VSWEPIAVDPGGNVRCCFPEDQGQIRWPSSRRIDPPRNLETTECMQSTTPTHVGAAPAFRILPPPFPGRAIRVDWLLAVLRNHAESFVKRDTVFPAGPDTTGGHSHRVCEIVRTAPVLPRARKPSFDFPWPSQAGPGAGSGACRDQEPFRRRAPALPMRKGGYQLPEESAARALPIPRFLIQMMSQARPTFGQVGRRRPGNRHQPFAEILKREVSIFSAA